MKNAFLLRVGTTLFSKCGKPGLSNANSNNFHTIQTSGAKSSKETKLIQTICYCYGTQRFASSSNENRDSNRESSSRSHQQNHRKSYERKRTNHARYSNSSADGTSLQSASDEMNHYQRLNVESDADQDTIKSAYYSLSKLYHPDVAKKSDKNAADNFRLITESYGVLSDPNQRADYDSELRLNGNRMRDLTNIMNKDININPIYRNVDAELIFRARQEAAFEREKAAEPRKYRAGSFGQSVGTRADSSRKMDSLSRQLQNASLTSRGNSTDGSDFYKQHLIQTLQRRRDDLAQHHERVSVQSGDATGILVLMGMVVLSLVYLLANFFLKLDIPAYLDTCLENRPREQETQDKSEKVTSQR